jgi:hypothetical protein
VLSRQHDLMRPVAINHIFAQLAFPVDHGLLLRASILLRPRDKNKHRT